MQGLGTAEHGRQGLVGHPHDIVRRLLGGERHPGGLAVKAHLERPLVARAVPLPQVARPDPPGGAQLGEFLEEVVVDVPEERQARRELVDVAARARCRARRR